MEFLRGLQCHAPASVDWGGAVTKGPCLDAARAYGRVVVGAGDACGAVVAAAWRVALVAENTIQP